MPRVIDEDLSGRVIISDQRLDVRHRDAVVDAAEMGDRGAGGRVVLEDGGDEAALIGHAGGKVGAALRNAPRTRPAVAIAGHEPRPYSSSRAHARRPPSQAVVVRMA